MAESVILRRAVKAEAYRAFVEEKVSFTEIAEWCEENCGRWNQTPEKLQAWLIDSYQNELAAANLDRSTDAQKVARLAGATLKRALQADVDALSAVKVKYPVDRAGKFVLDENGKRVCIETPDHEIRLSASKEIKKVLGAYAAEKLEVLAGPLDEFAALTDEQLKREIAKYRKGAGIETPAGIDGATSGEGLPLLPAERDVDQGRAGRGEPLQAVPIATLLSADSRRPQ